MCLPLAQLSTIEPHEDRPPLCRSIIALQHCSCQTVGADEVDLQAAESNSSVVISASLPK